MPYVFVEELAEGQEEADVVERAEVDALTQTLNETQERLDQAVQRGMEWQEEVKKVKRDYADKFLATPIEKSQRAPITPPSCIGGSFSSIFGGADHAN